MQETERLKELLIEKRVRSYKKDPFSIITDGLLKIKTKKEGIINLYRNSVLKKLLNYITEKWKEDKPI